MTTYELLCTLHRRGVTLTRQADGRITSMRLAGGVPANLKAEIVRHRENLLPLFDEPGAQGVPLVYAGPGGGVCAFCGGTDWRSVGLAVHCGNCWRVPGTGEEVPHGAPSA